LPKVSSGPQYRGIVRPAKGFASKETRDVAEAIERDYGPSFEPLGATLKLRPIRISALSHVGEGVSVDLVPHDVKQWNWFGDFESGIETRTRRRFSREWLETRSLSEVEAWLRREAAAYLEELREKEQSLAVSGT
jgi:hypothetical protein